MATPARPAPDHYDKNIQVAPHFTWTPGLTEIASGHRYNRGNSSISKAVRREVGALYAKHNVQRCLHGLFWAGGRYWTELEDRDKTLLLVIGLREHDVEKWRLLDPDAKAILTKYNLDGRHGVCIRYYLWDTFYLQYTTEQLDRGEVEHGVPLGHDPQDDSDDGSIITDSPISVHTIANTSDHESRDILTLARERAAAVSTIHYARTVSQGLPGIDSTEQADGTRADSAIDDYDAAMHVAQDIQEMAPLRRHPRTGGLRLPASTQTRAAHESAGVSRDDHPGAGESRSVGRRRT